MTTRVEVDFNSRDDQGFVPAAPEDADGPIAVGDRVEAYDDEGYRCLARVVRIAGNAIHLDPLWQVFASPDDSRIVVTGAVAGRAIDYRNLLTVNVLGHAIVPQPQPRPGRRSPRPAPA